MEQEELIQTIEQANKDNLTQLDLSGHQIKALPPEIGKLTSLTWLDINGNQLTGLPSEIGKLTSLTKLDLTENQLTGLPPEIGKLTRLTRLDLSENQLTGLPSEIGKLTSLTRLDLSENQLTGLPPEISKLTSLRWLYLNGNKLKKLPPEINKLTSLTQLYLNENKQLEIPPEILWKTGEPDTIINYYLEHQIGYKKPLNEAKVLLVGQGSVGKTSLVKGLIANTFDLHEKKTEGINIEKWKVTVDNQEIRLNVWDFGGQEIMHSTHQFFLTKRSLYLLVLDCRLSEEDNRLEYWIKIIQSFGGNSPIIIVGNKTDQHQLDLDRSGIKNKYENIREIVETSCKTGFGIDKLKDLIAREIGSLDHISDMLLDTWFTVKDKLENMKQDYIPYQEYMEVCQKEDITDPLSQRTLIRFLHDLGIVLNFQDDLRLQDTNILNPEWVTTGVYKILNSYMLFQNKGVLEREMLNQILNDSKYHWDKHLFIIDMMRKFELCFDFEGFADKKFLIPDLLPKEGQYTGDWQDSLFQYHYNVLPGSIISRFIVRMHTAIYQNTYWRNGVVLSYQETKALVKSDIEERKIFIWVKGPDKFDFLSNICSNFDSIHKTIPNIEANKKVPIPDNPKIVVDYNHLLRLEKMGETKYIPEGTDQKISVIQVLGNVRPQETISDEKPVTTPSKETELLQAKGKYYDLKIEFDNMTEKKKILDEEASKLAKRGLWICTGGLIFIDIVLAVLTWKLTWNVMAQITYFIGCGALVISCIYIAITNKEPNPVRIYNKFVQERVKKKYVLADFNLEHYEDLKNNIDTLHDKIKSLEGLDHRFGH